MFNKKKRVEKAFELIAIFIDKCNLSETEKRNLKGLLMNIKSRMEEA
ncbi:hypothetical protein VYH85_07385 [Streptococcus anginosus]|nr:hypothetical protein [Streptococcus anginosus]MED5952547.1 hypothetical protein [Streptococcus anginosus]MED5956578.1 hypothetical protein [Streptococcus anginosus]